MRKSWFIESNAFSKSTIIKCALNFSRSFTSIISEMRGPLLPINLT